MRVREIDILIVPDRGALSPDHWQSRWARNLQTARIVEQDDLYRPDRERWVGRLCEAAASCSRPTVLVAHGCGVVTVAHSAPGLAGSPVVGAFLVAPTDLEARGPIDDRNAARGGEPPFSETFVPLPMQSLPFPSKLIASSTDPFCSVERAHQFGAAWGADVSVIAGAGHIDTESGHGPWPEGLLTFGLFLRRLRPH